MNHFNIDSFQIQEDDEIISNESISSNFLANNYFDENIGAEVVV